MLNNYMQDMYSPQTRIQQLEQQLQQLQQPMQQQYFAPMKQSIEFVGGFEGAKSYQLAANSNTILMDNTEPIFYMVQTDGNGMRTIKAFTFNEIEIKQTSQQNVDMSKYVTKEDFNKLVDQIKTLMGGELDG